jgi:hypothetical protein
VQRCVNRFHCAKKKQFLPESQPEYGFQHPLDNKSRVYFSPHVNFSFLYDFFLQEKAEKKIKKKNFELENLRCLVTFKLNILLLHSRIIDTFFVLSGG